MLRIKFLCVQILKKTICVCRWHCSALGLLRNSFCCTNSLPIHKNDMHSHYGFSSRYLLKALVSTICFYIHTFLVLLLLLLTYRLKRNACHPRKLFQTPCKLKNSLLSGLCFRYLPEIRVPYFSRARHGAAETISC